MAPLISFYFQVHQPYRLRDLRVTDIGRDDLSYFDDDKNRAVFRKVAEKCYLPANALMLELLEQYPDWHISYSLSGVFMEQCEQYGPDVLESFKKLAKTGRVEFLAETYYHSLSALKSLPEFCAQVKAHTAKIQEHFGQTPTVFRNTELIYRNELAHVVRLLGYRGILAEGTDHLLAGRTPNHPYMPPRFRLPRGTEVRLSRMRHLPKKSDDIFVLLKNYSLSDDIAFRFSNKSWAGHPLTAEKFTDWVSVSAEHCVNLFMDYETFGEHQWADTGIFDFLRALPRVWQERGIKTATPSQVLDAWGERPTPIYDVHGYISWADLERDLSAWLGNRIQDAALDAAFALEEQVKASGDPKLLDTWRKLLTSDHFYYMCTKYWSDGDVHKYFSPYDSPYEAYRRYSHALCDLRGKLQKAEKPRKTPTQKIHA